MLSFFSKVSSAHTPSQSGSHISSFLTIPHQVQQDCWNLPQHRGVFCLYHNFSITLLSSNPHRKRYCKTWAEELCSKNYLLPNIDLNRRRYPVYHCWLYREPRETSFAIEGSELGAQGLSRNRLPVHNSNKAIRRILKKETKCPFYFKFISDFQLQLLLSG